MCMKTRIRKPEQETTDQGREAIEVAYTKTLPLPRKATAFRELNGRNSHILLGSLGWRGWRG